MADHVALPETLAGEGLRALILARRKRARRAAWILAIAAAAALLSIAGILWKPSPLLLWNASASAPMGLYRVQPSAPVRRGDLVAAWTPEPARRLAAERHYLPSNIPLVKRVAAIEGDQVCASGHVIRINGERSAVRFRLDPSGRPMPWWTGCSRLAPGEYFLLMEHKRSFDGRYFGIARQEDLLGRAVLLWARPARRGADG